MIEKLEVSKIKALIKDPSISALAHPNVFIDHFSGAT